jgi:hypothetical protein
LAEVKSVTVSASPFDTNDTGAVSAGVLMMVGRLKQASHINLSKHESYATSHRRANLYHGERKMGWVDYDIENLAEHLPTFVVPVVEDMGWSLSYFPCMRGIAIVYHGTHFERVGLWTSETHRSLIERTSTNSFMRVITMSLSLNEHETWDLVRK